MVLLKTVAFFSALWYIGAGVLIMEEERKEALEQEKKQDPQEEPMSETDQEYVDPEAAEPEGEQTPDPAIQQGEKYVERPKEQRILAWALFGVVVLGVILYYCWIAGILK